MTAHSLQGSYYARDTRWGSNCRSGAQSGAGETASKQTVVVHGVGPTGAAGRERLVGAQAGKLELG